jgi:hypothetical protein
MKLILTEEDLPSQEADALRNYLSGSLKTLENFKNAVDWTTNVHILLGLLLLSRKRNMKPGAFTPFLSRATANRKL